MTDWGLLVAIISIKLCVPDVSPFDFSTAAVPPPRKTRAELMKDIDADYYGYRDEDDGVLVPLEQEYEKQGGQVQLNTRNAQFIGGYVDQYWCYQGLLFSH